jgi:magnesium transporter
MSAVLSDLAATFMLRHPAEAAALLDSLTPEDAGRMLSRLDAGPSSEILGRLSPDLAARTLERLAPEEARRMMAAMDFVRLAVVLAQMDEEARGRLLAMLSADQRRHVTDAADYPRGSAGQLMDPRFVSFREDTTAADALERVRTGAHPSSSTLLVVDVNGRLTGTASLQELLAAPEERVLRDLARPPVFVGAVATRDEVVELLRRHPSEVLPVVDLDGRLLGVLHQQALVRVAEHALADDLQQMVGANKDERALSSVPFTVKSRLPWLMINLGTGFLAATVVGLFDATIAKFTALAVLMPVVAGQAGNTGAQALAVVSRGLALREIRLGHAPRVLRKELASSVVNGITVALVTSLATLLWSNNGWLAVVLGASMVASMVIAALAGAAVPMVLTALKRDPATASSIVLTTVTDVAGFSSFLGLATALSELLGA